MTIDPSRRSWTPVELPVLTTIQLTTEARELSRANWPEWATRSTQFSRILVYLDRPGSEPQAASASTGVLTALLTERIDPKDAPQVFNYNLYLIAQTTDGRLFQSPPIRPSDPGHHSSSPSTWFDELGSPL